MSISLLPKPVDQSSRPFDDTFRIKRLIQMYVVRENGRQSDKFVIIFSFTFFGDLDLMLYPIHHWLFLTENLFPLLGIEPNRKFEEAH